MNIIIIDFFLLSFPAIYYYFKELKKEKNHKYMIRKLMKILGLNKINLKILNYASELIIIMIIATIILNYSLQFLGLNDLEKTYNVIMQFKEHYFILAYLLSIRVISEEIFFRGFLTKETGIIISSILFSLAHVFYYSFAELLGAFVLGIILAWYYKKNNNLYSNIIAHSLYNFIFILLMFS